MMESSMCFISLHKKTDRISTCDLLQQRRMGLGKSYRKGTSLLRDNQAIMKHLLARKQQYRYHQYARL